jgi:hypothetical protein
MYLFGSNFIKMELLNVHLIGFVKLFSEVY